MKTPESGKDTNVLRKMPEEIKKGLECCSDIGYDPHCKECPYDKIKWCCDVKNGDAIAYIQQLEGDLAEERELNEFLRDKVKQLESRLEQAERERDAAINELPHHCWNCAYHRDDPIEEIDTRDLTIHRYCDADVCYPEEENSSWQ